MSFRLPHVRRGEQPSADWYRTAESWLRAVTPQPGAGVHIATGPGGTTSTAASNRARTSTTAMPAFYVHQTAALEVKVTAGNIQFPNADVTAVALSSAIAVANGNKVYLQRALDRTFSFVAGASAPVDKGYFPLATIAASGSAITSITRTWTGGDIQWPSTEIDFLIEVASNKDYPLVLSASERLVVDNLVIKTTSGSCTVALKIDGVAVTGLSAVSVTSTESTTHATAACVLSPGETLTLTVSSNSAAVNLHGTILFL